jgi:hypothetical protein
MEERMEPLAQGFEIDLGLGGPEVGEQLGAPAHEVEAAAQEIAGGAPAAGIDVGLGEVAAPQELGDLPGVELVALGLEAVDRTHGESVSENEGDALVLAEIGEPVPGEETLAADDQVVAVGRDGGEKGLGATG